MVSITNGPLTGTATMDDVMTMLGVGPWTCLFFVVAALSLMSEVINLVGAQFMAPPLAFTCADPLLDDNIQPINGTQCYVSTTSDNDTSLSVIQPCQHFIFDNSTFISTVTMEFGLVCSRESLRTLFQLMFTIGCLVGSPLGGLLSDKYGRQPAVWYGSVLVAAFTILLVMVPMIEVVLAARFFLGLFTMVYATPAYTISVEICPIKLRSTYGVAQGLPSAAMLSILAGIAYEFRSWRPIQMCASLPLFLVVVLANPYLLNESPRWLVERGRLQEAEAALRRAAKWNKSSYSLPEDLLDVLAGIHSQQLGDCRNTPSQGHSSSRERLLSLVSSSSMLRITVITIIVWFFIGTLYISIPLRADSFSSPFLYMALLGVAEIPAYSVTAPITDRLGRRTFVISCLVLTAVMQILLTALTAAHENIEWGDILISTVSYTFICSVFQVNLLYCSELFPTSVRTLGTSLAYFFANVGFNIPPILDTYLPPDLPWLLMLIYSVLALGAAGLILLLPETNKRPLMQTVQENEQYMRQKQLLHQERRQQSQRNNEAGQLTTQDN